MIRVASDFNDMDLKSILEIQSECFADSLQSENVVRKLLSSTFVYITDEKIVAYVQVARSKNLSSLFEPYTYTVGSISCITLITNIAVVSAYRNKGIAKKLIAHVLNLAKNKLLFENANNYLGLQVREKNPAKYLYDKCGFKTIGVLLNYYKNGENAIAQIIDVNQN